MDTPTEKDYIDAKLDTLDQTIAYVRDVSQMAPEVNAPVVIYPKPQPNQTR